MAGLGKARLGWAREFVGYLLKTPHQNKAGYGLAWPGTARPGMDGCRFTLNRH